MTNPADPSEPPKEDHQGFSQKWDHLKKNQRLNRIYDYSQQNPRDTIAYILLVLGMIILFFNPFFGALLIGIVLGLYYSAEFLFVFYHLNEFIHEQGIVRSITAGAALLAIAFGAPGLVIGTGFSVMLRSLFGSDPSKK